jgi:hypothetical protein
MRHKVEVDLCNYSAITLGKPDIIINVSLASGKIGTLLISKGNIEWKTSPKSVKKHRLTWSQFAAKMEEQGKSVMKKKKA